MQKYSGESSHLLLGIDTIICGLSLLLVLSLAPSESFFSRLSSFSLSSKTNTAKFQFDLECTGTFKQALKNS